MKIKEIREYLLKYPQYFSHKNKIKIEDMKSQNRYYFLPECGHKIYALPTNVFVNDSLLCPVCSGKQVNIGINDLHTTHPEYAQQLLNVEEGYQFTFGSNKKLWWKCKECGYIFFQSPNKVCARKSFCTECGKIRSYAERYISNFLLQLCEVYSPQKIFDWSEHKSYDFYLPEYNMIIEAHGKQHYYCDFSGVGGRTLEEEQENDQLKMDLATRNHIQYYITIDCSKSENDYVRKSIMTSLLPTILNFKEDDIDWKQCHCYAIENIVKEVCLHYDKDVNNIEELTNMFSLSRNTIVSYLKKGSELQWCNYDADYNKKRNHKENGQRVIQTMSRCVQQLDVNGQVIKEYPSIQEAQRQLSISHIWDCVHGKRKTAGGFIWKYKE